MALISGRKYEGSFNVSPMEMGLVLTSAKHFDDESSSDDIVLAEMLWGFIPTWHKVCKNKAVDLFSNLNLSAF